MYVKNTLKLCAIQILITGKPGDKFQKHKQEDASVKLPLPGVHTLHITIFTVFLCTLVAFFTNTLKFYTSKKVTRLLVLPERIHFGFTVLYMLHI